MSPTPRWKIKNGRVTSNMKKFTKNTDKIELVRLVTAGSVDDGKSTLIGRLLYDTDSLTEEHIESLKNAGGSVKDIPEHLANLLDGLKAEREQGITIDVAYRYFSTDKRRFIIADVPGHEQYTRNMVTGASTADIALLLVDARHGVLQQTKRHLFVASLLGIPHIAIVVNKMDLKRYSQKVYQGIKDEITEFAARLNLHDLQFMPISAKKGDMVVERGKNMNWYKGRTLLDYLENLQVISDRNIVDFRFPVQTVVQAANNYRGYAGTIEGGKIKKGEKIRILPSNERATVASIKNGGKAVDNAICPQTSMLSVREKVDISRGDMIVRENNIPDQSSDLEAMICWFNSEPLKTGKSYIIKHLTKSIRGRFPTITYRINVDNLHREKCRSLKINEIGKVHLDLTQPIPFDPYNRNRNTGSFIIIDEITNQTVGAGIILKKKVLDKKSEKSGNKEGIVVWFTGLSGSGKSTIAERVYEKLQNRHIRTEWLDGDITREHLCKDLGFSKKDRDTNIERVSFVAGLLSKHGVIVLATYISPYRKQRKLARKQAENFAEVFVKASVKECERRDVKGLYKKARKGEIENFTGISDPYEKPTKPELTIDTKKDTVAESAQKVLDYLRDQGYIE